MAPRKIEVEEEMEGQLVESDDSIFDKIGEPVPVSTTPDFKYDPQSCPSRPLAVSEQHGVVFVAHSSGFFVAKTKDVMASAAEIKEKGKSSSVQELSVVDVPLAKLNILALSTDNSTLAATADANIYFFSVGSLLDKGLEPSSSCSLNESGSVKDFQWTKKSENKFLALSNLGKLFHGTIGSPIKFLMDSVDAVEWSPKGKLIAVVRKDCLNILSSKFVERSSILLSFMSWIDDPDASCIIKVDSIRWVRSDSIIIGCFQLNADGNEENYLVQAIQVKDGKFTNDSCKPVVTSFYDLFSGLIDDILPPATGPYLFLSYLEECELAITANRKNTDQHVVYLSWSLGEERNEVVIVDILRETLKPRIELQENGDDNLIMGLCLDKVSRSQKISVRLGMEQREFSPYCILICLTLDGKILMYHVASVSDNTVKPASVSTSSDEEEDFTAFVPVGSEPTKLSAQLRNEQFKKVSLAAPLDDNNIKEHDRTVGLFKGDDQKFLNVNESLISTPFANKKEITSSDKKVESSQSLKGQQELPFSNPYASKNFKQEQLSVLENRNVLEASTDSFSQEGNNHVFRDLSKTGDQKNALLVASSISGVNSSGKMLSTGSQSVSSQSWSSGKIITPKGNDVKSLAVSSNVMQGSRSGDASQLGATPGMSTISSSGMPFENKGQRPSATAGNITSVPSISSYQMSSQEIFSIGKSRMPNSEPNVSKKFGNITELTKELDMFLQYIEEVGGFRDACIVNQQSSVNELEREIGILSNRCRMWKSTMDERLQEVQHLFDLTVQVLARKIYMEGIVKQAADRRYWDFCSFQKLSSELELKRRHIIKMNQELTDQLIELDRHFNALELNKFGGNEGAHAGRTALQSRIGPSRHTESLHSLHSTMTSQLAAAGQLSECLSKQMAALQVESPSAKQKNVKKELFETIGIPYDASFSSPSPDVTKFRGTPKDKLPFSLGLSAAKDQPRRNVSATKNFEPETARRRRDSLDRSWEIYEPTKATVKRLLSQERGKVSVNRSSLSIDNQCFSSRLLEGSAVSCPWDHTIPATFLDTSEHKGIQDAQPKRAFATPFGTPSGSVRQNLISGTNRIAEKSGEGQTFSTKSDSVSAKEKSVFPSDTSQKPSSFMLHTQPTSLLKPDTSQEPLSFMIPTQPTSLLKPNDILNPDTKETARTTEDSVKDRSLNTKVASSEAEKKLVSPFPSFPVSGTPNLFKKNPQSNVATSKIQPGDKSSSGTYSMSVPASSFSIFSSSAASLSPISCQASASPTLPSLMPLNKSLDGSTTSADFVKPVSTSSVSAFSFPLGPPSGSSPFNDSKSLAPSSDISQVTSSASEPPKTEIQPSSKVDINVNTIVPAVESGPTPSETSLNLKPLTSPPTIAVETSTALAPGNQSSPNNASPAPAEAPGSQLRLQDTSGPAHNVTINAQEQSSTQSLFQITLSKSESVTGRTNGLDVQNQQEDDMDEEAPDTSSLTGLTVGSLGALGFGSSSNPPAAKPNPFGGPFGNAATTVTSSPFPTTIPSGGLFKPATLTFQSLQPANTGAFSGGFVTNTTAQAPNPGGVGQPSQVGPGQQALGSVLGGFGQSRQIGTGLPGSGFGGVVAGTTPAGGFSGAPTGGFVGASSTVGGFAAAASSGGGFAALASGAGGFGGAASGGGGFGGAALGGGGFGGLASGGSGGFGGLASAGGGGFGGLASAGVGGFGGLASAGGGGFGGAATGGSGFGGLASGGGGDFGGAAPAGSGFAGANLAGGGFGQFDGQQGSGGFSAFGNAGGTQKPPDIFQIRK